MKKVQKIIEEVNHNTDILVEYLKLIIEQLDTIIEKLSA